MKWTIAKIIESLVERGYNVDFVYTPEDEVSLSYISNNNIRIIVSSNRTWEDELAHEFCHSIQDEKNPEFFSVDVDIIDKWARRKIELTPKKLLEKLRLLLLCERDCERKTVKLLKNCDFYTGDINRYIQGANGYILYYLVRVKYRLPDHIFPVGSITDSSSHLSTRFISESRFDPLPSIDPIFERNLLSMSTRKRFKEWEGWKKLLACKIK